jgi:hypothetical protein
MLYAVKKPVYGTKATHNKGNGEQHEMCIGT